MNKKRIGSFALSAVLALSIGSFAVANIATENNATTGIYASATVDEEHTNFKAAATTPVECEAVTLTDGDAPTLTEKDVQHGPVIHAIYTVVDTLAKTVGHILMIPARIVMGFFGIFSK